MTGEDVRGMASDSPHREHAGDGIIIPILHKKVFVTRHLFSNLYTEITFMFTAARTARSCVKKSTWP